MRDNSVHHDLHVFAIELRKLAYTMPPGHEDRLIRLSDQMVRRAGQSAPAQRHA